MHTVFAEVTAIRYRARTYTNEAERRRTLEGDVRRGLTSHPKSLPPKYFYDTTGSKLFEDITEQPEYYLTRTERALLGEIAPALMREVAPRDLIELGAGSALKTRRLLDARSDQPVRYIPIDVDESMIQVAANRLLADYPLLSVEAIVGDFERHLHDVPAPLGPRLVLFLGSTIGNLDPLPRRELPRGLRSRQGRGAARGCVRRRERRDPRVQSQHPRRGQPGARRGLPAGGLRPRRLVQRDGVSRGNAPRARRGAADSRPRAGPDRAHRRGRRHLDGELLQVHASLRRRYPPGSGAAAGRVAHRSGPLLRARPGRARLRWGKAGTRSPRRAGSTSTTTSARRLPSGSALARRPPGSHGRFSTLWVGTASVW